MSDMQWFVAGVAVTFVASMGLLGLFVVIGARQIGKQLRASDEQRRETR